LHGANLLAEITSLGEGKMRRPFEPFQRIIQAMKQPLAPGGGQAQSDMCQLRFLCG
jgi:hypothetical protein